MDSENFNYGTLTIADVVCRYCQPSSTNVCPTLSLSIHFCVQC